MKQAIGFLIVFIFLSPSGRAQELHSRWDELTASEWPKALLVSGKTCILPIVFLEKHGPHVPIGSDLIQVREWAARATKKNMQWIPGLFLWTDERSKASVRHVCAA